MNWLINVLSRNPLALMALGGLSLVVGVGIAWAAVSLHTSFPDEPERLDFKEAAARADSGRLTWLRASTPAINCRDLRQGDDHELIATLSTAPLIVGTFPGAEFDCEVARANGVTGTIRRVPGSWAVRYGLPTSEPVYEISVGRGPDEAAAAATAALIFMLIGVGFLTFGRARRAALATQGV
jgi:hypothetical protein